MNGQAYAAAWTVAPRVHAYFARHLAEARARGIAPLASLPDEDAIGSMIDAAFWTSLRREEGYVPRISLAFLSPSEADHPLTLDRPLPLSAGALTRVAPAVERAGIHLGVSKINGGELAVWGTTRGIPALCLVLEVTAPGLLVIKHHRGDESGKYINVAVLEGDQVKLVDERASLLPDCPKVLPTLLGFESPDLGVDSTNVLVQLAVSMRATGRGGALLVVPPNTETWRESIVWPALYAVSPAFSELQMLNQTPPEHERERYIWQEALARAVNAMAGLTAVDGATVITSQYDLLAFGATIARRKGFTQVSQVVVTEPIEGGAADLVPPEQLGGTRHQYCAQFVHDQRDSVALVASRDGRFTIFAWSPIESMVHAHRVEALLL
jgi:sensor domain DACNV-containing protein